MPVAAIHWGTLFQVVWVSLVAGIGVSAVFSLVILASARASEANRTGRSQAALGFAVLAGLALLVFGAGIALGMRAMLAKD
jgi:F0F1-type ATP synthase membrane subunit c/vacuolar-type H+-ATPase subunit K